MDAALEPLGRSRRVAVRLPYFTAAAPIVAATDLVLTAPARLARRLGDAWPVRAIPPPVPVAGFTASLCWHARFDRDPGLRWLLDRVRALAPAAA